MSESEGLIRGDSEFVLRGCESEDSPRREADVVYYGDELRLYATSEYAKSGGHVGVYFKAKKRKSRMGQTPLACLPPIGTEEGEFFESILRCVDPRGLKSEHEAVKVGDEVLLVDRDGHAWNTSTAGIVEYLTLRLRGERGELRVRFAKDLKKRNSSDDDSSPGRSPHLARPKSTGRLRSSPRDRPSVRFGDSLFLVSCPQHDETHPGAGRYMRREHVLTNYKRETSSLKGGYLTVDPRGHPIQFSIQRSAPTIDTLKIGRATFFNLPWRHYVAFEDETSSDLELEFSSGSKAKTKIENTKTWLQLGDGLGSVLVDLRCCRPSRSSSTKNSGFLLLRRAKKEIVASILLALAFRDDARIALVLPLYALNPAFLVVMIILPRVVAWLVYVLAVSYHVKKMVQEDDDENDAIVTSSAAPRGAASGEVAVLEWTSETKAVTPQDHLVESSELSAIAALRAAVAEDSFSPRWLEDGELLRFVRARKTAGQRIDLFREAMAWRKQRTDDVYLQSTNQDPALGSFGILEREWTRGSVEAPEWWKHLTDTVPLQVYGADDSGLPITYVGFGRMDLTSICRDLGPDRLEQKLVMLNDMFLDVAREQRFMNPHLRALHGGVFIIDLDGMSRRVLRELNIFKRVSTALKVLHPERQRKTFIVRAPRAFTLVWKLVKPMLDARIISKISILGDNVKPLIDELGLPNVPTVLGGRFRITALHDAPSSSS
ncbi:hypothetical protein CTAYLR_007486 [Chrysophaeum taylorii]|uniref:CRAL-TRIO domain-containing protein n=1 Tax=Chrysophaeum taylorii TaxID=2483200 RepID=A0AAD7UCB5_9STRA|nr:hypothetical protein CTAYLR_007486 [Chrysophaeum taylorii]